MKKLFLLLFSVPFFCAAQNKNPERFTLTAKLADLPDSVQVSLMHPSSSSPVAQVYSKNKGFTASGELQFGAPGRITISGKGVNASLDLYLGPGNTIITGTVKNLDKAQVTGSPEQAVFKGFLKVFVPRFKELNALNAELQTQYDAGKRDAITQQFDKVKNSMSGQIDSFLKKNDASVISAFLLYTTKDLFHEEAAITSARLEQLTGAASVSVYKEALQKEVSDLLFGTVGSVAPDFSQPDTAGLPVKLSSFRGKYVLLDFWASWCGPCRMENPNVVDAFQKFRNKNFTVLGVSLDRPGYKDAWVQAIKDDNLTWTHVSDLKFWQNEVAMLYRVSSIPQNYLLDPSGKIIGKNLRGPALEQKLCEVLGCK